MKKITLITILLAAVAVQYFSGCQRRPLEDEYSETARIPVKIDWSKSNIPVTDTHGNGYVHRVSLRFFPKDGSPAFDRYLEQNVIEGEIDVPIGEYSVVVFNESVYDTYWQDAIYFSGVDSYSGFAAHIVNDPAENYPHYTPLAQETLAVEPFRLASWSLDDFKITKEIVTRTRALTRANYAGGDTEIALTKIIMRPLTYNVNVTAHVENLCSAQLLQGAMRGFAQKAYMASARTMQVPATHIFKLNSRRWDDNDQKHGTVSKTFLSFGPLPQAALYMVNVDAVYVTGEVHDTPLLFDVTDQVNAQASEIDIEIIIDLSLPYVEGGIGVGDWDDEVHTIQ